jgi:hypothetical protein
MLIANEEELDQMYYSEIQNLGNPIGCFVPVIVEDVGSYYADINRALYAHSHKTLATDPQSSRIARRDSPAVYNVNIAKSRARREWAYWDDYDDMGSILKRVKKKAKKVTRKVAKTTRPSVVKKKAAAAKRAAEKAAKLSAVKKIVKATPKTIKKVTKPSIVKKAARTVKKAAKPSVVRKAARKVEKKVVKTAKKVPLARRIINATVKAEKKIVAAKKTITVNNAKKLVQVKNLTKAKKAVKKAIKKIASVSPAQIAAKRIAKAGKSVTKNAFEDTKRLVEAERKAALARAKEMESKIERQLAFTKADISAGQREIAALSEKQASLQAQRHAIQKGLQEALLKKAAEAQAKNKFNFTQLSTKQKTNFQTLDRKVAAGQAIIEAKQKQHIQVLDAKMQERDEKVMKTTILVGAAGVAVALLAASRKKD